MSRDLTNLFIDETFQYLTQISGSELQDGLGNRITELDITASNSISASHSVTADSSSYSVTSSYALDNYTAATNTFSDITLTKGDGTTTILDTTPNQMVEKIINRNGFMPKGTPVYVSGSTGDQLDVYGADAGDANKMPAVFILAQDLDPNEAGLGILSGEITQVDTSAFEDGDEIWVGVGGGYTNQRPTGSNTLVQKLGAVVKAQGNGSGVIFGAGRSNDLPNIPEGYVWVGDADGVAQLVATASIAPVTSSYALQALSSSYALTASYALNAGGGGFPYTGSAEITGSLGVTGSISSKGSINLNPFNNTFLDVNEFGLQYATIDSGSVITTLNNFGGQSTIITNYNADNSNVSAAGGLNYNSNNFMQFTSNNEGVAFNSPTQIDFNALVFNNPVDINLNGSAFLYTAASNINGFSILVNQLSVVKPFMRAFVETPLIVGDQGTVEVSDNSTLKVINEL